MPVIRRKGLSELQKKRADELFDKILTVAILVVAVVILGLLLFLYYNVHHNKLFNSLTYDYSCSSYEEQVKNTNTTTLSYYITSVDNKYDTILMSPLSIQSAIYDYYSNQNTQKPEVFDFFQNGYNTWYESGAIFKSDCMISELPGVVASSETLVGRTTVDTENVINTLGFSVDYDENTLYSIFYMKYGLKDGIYSSKDDMIYYDGEIDYKRTDEYEAVKIPLSNDDYSIYLIDGDLTNFTTEDFESKVALVNVAPYIWQSSGKMNNVASKLGYTDTDLVILNQFGFGASNHEVVETYTSETTDTYYYVTDFSFIIVDNETGLMLAFGKHY
jgi:hypothetical protein